MQNPIDQIIDSYNPNTLKDQFSRLCYEVFLNTQDGKVLMAHMFEEYVNKPFTDLQSTGLEVDPNSLLFRSAWRDLVQRLLVRAQQYERALKKNKEGDIDGRDGSTTITPE